MQKTKCAFYINLLVTVRNLELSDSVILIGNSYDSSYVLGGFSSLPEFYQPKRQGR